MVKTSHSQSGLEKPYKSLRLLLPYHLNNDHDLFSRLKQSGIHIEVFSPCGDWFGEEIKSKYHAIGADYFGEGTSKLEPIELEQELREDARCLLEEKGMVVSVRGPSYRIRPLREIVSFR